MYKFKLISDYPTNTLNLYDVIEFEYSDIDKLNFYRKYPALFKEITSDEDWWYGYIEYMAEDNVYVRLKKEYELDRELVFNYAELDDHFKLTLDVGNICRYNIKELIMEYMGMNGVWKRIFNKFDYIKWE